MSNNNATYNNINVSVVSDVKKWDIEPLSRDNFFVNRIMNHYGYTGDVITDILDSRETYEGSPEQFPSEMYVIKLYDMAQSFLTIDTEIFDILKSTMFWYVYNNFNHEIPVFTDIDEKGVEHLRMNLVVDYLIKKWVIIYWNDIRFIWSGERFVEDKHQIEKDAVEILKEIGYSDKRKAEPIVRDIIYKISKESAYIRNKHPFNKLDNRYVSCRNGVVVRKKKGCIVPNSPAFGFSHRIGVDYDPNINTDEVMKFIEDIVAEKDVKHLIRILSHILMRDAKYQLSYLLVGEGSNGKSVFIKLLTKTVGIKNLSRVSLQDLVDNKFATADLLGKLLNVYSDLEKDELKNTGKFKLLSSGDGVSAEKKFKDRFDFENIAVFVFSANDVPTVNDNTWSFWRRWSIINFPIRFEVDPEFEARMITNKNASALLKLAVDEMEDIDKNGIHRNEEVAIIREMWQRRSSSLYSFVTDKVEQCVGGEVSRAEFMREYSIYCAQNMATPESKDIYSRLSRMISGVSEGYIGSTRMIKGIRFKTQHKPISNQGTITCS